MGKHWTNESDKDFMFAAAMDFLAELETVMEEHEMSRKGLADKLGVTEGRVSQIFNNPGNLTLGVMVKWARALKLKVALVAYDDGDYENENGPIFPGIFRSCWEHLKKPTDGWELEEAIRPVELFGEGELEGLVANLRKQVEGVLLVTADEPWHRIEDVDEKGCDGSAEKHWDQTQYGEEVAA
jgi:transcriptional regulator with XRE-family HTH domain